MNFIKAVLAGLAIGASFSAAVAHVRLAHTNRCLSILHTIVENAEHNLHPSLRAAVLSEYTKECE